MSEQIEVIEKELEHTLEKRVDCTMMKMPMEIKIAYKEIIDYLKSKDIEVGGMPFVKYLNINWDEVMEESRLKAFLNIFTRKWHMLIGFPVKEKIEGMGNLSAGIFEAGKYVKTVHKGPYQKVTPAYKRLVTYTKTENINIKDEAMEIYTNDPKTTPKEELETIIFVPVAKS